jgi:hypothetical protein
MRTIATRPIRTIWSACGYGFTVCVFAIEIRFAAFVIVEVAATFKGDGFFAFAAWLSRRTLTAFSARSLALRPAIAISALRRRHFCALLAENRFAAQLNAVSFNSQDFHQHRRLLEFVFHFYAMFSISLMCSSPSFPND